MVSQAAGDIHNAAIRAAAIFFTTPWNVEVIAVHLDGTQPRRSRSGEDACRNIGIVERDRRRIIAA